MSPSNSLRYAVLPTFGKLVAPWLILATSAISASSVQAGVVPNSDSRHSDNGTNDPYFVNAGDSNTFFNVFGDDVLVMNGGLISNQAPPKGWWRSPIRLLDQSQAIINGGLIQDIDPSGVTWGLHLEGQSRLTVNSGTFRQNSSPASPFVYASDDSVAVINGGDFHSLQGTAVGTWFRGSTTINGGTFASDRDDVVDHRGQGLVTINGGTFSGAGAGVVVLQGDLILSGGRFETDVDLIARGGDTELIARSAALSGAPLDEGPILLPGGVIDLVWRDGTAASLRFQHRGGVIRLTLIPEPSTLMLGVLGFALWPTRRF